MVWPSSASTSVPLIVTLILPVPGTIGHSGVKSVTLPPAWSPPLPLPSPAGWPFVVPKLIGSLL